MKKAFAWLEGNGIEYRFHDYKKAGVPADKVKAWLRQSGAVLAFCPAAPADGGTGAVRVLLKRR
jgi:arsenate reductase-like glutaredoxin family protein